MESIDTDHFNVVVVVVSLFFFKIFFNCSD